MHLAPEFIHSGPHLFLGGPLLTNSEGSHLWIPNNSSGSIIVYHDGRKKKREEVEKEIYYNNTSLCSKEKGPEGINRVFVEGDCERPAAASSAIMWRTCNSISSLH